MPLSVQVAGHPFQRRLDSRLLGPCIWYELNVKVFSKDVSQNPTEVISTKGKFAGAVAWSVSQGTFSFLMKPGLYIHYRSRVNRFMEDHCQPASAYRGQEHPRHAQW